MPPGPLWHLLRSGVIAVYLRTPLPARLPRRVLKMPSRLVRSSHPLGPDSLCVAVLCVPVHREALLCGPFCSAVPTRRHPPYPQRGADGWQCWRAGASSVHPTSVPRASPGARRALRPLLRTFPSSTGHLPSFHAHRVAGRSPRSCLWGVRARRPSGLVLYCVVAAGHR